MFKKGDLVTRLPEHQELFWRRTVERHEEGPNGVYVVRCLSFGDLWLEGIGKPLASRKFQLHISEINLDDWL
jgi:hypothetical protein